VHGIHCPWLFSFEASGGRKSRKQLANPAFPGNYYFRSTAIFPGGPGLANSPTGHLFWKANLWGIVEWGYYRVDMFPATQPSVSKH